MSARLRNAGVSWRTAPGRFAAFSSRAVRSLETKLFTQAAAIEAGAFGGAEGPVKPIRPVIAYDRWFGPLILGVGVALIDAVAWLLGLPAPLFTDLSWKWWIASMVLASGLHSASTLSKVASQEPSKTSLRYVLCEFFGQALGPFAFVLVAWMCFEPEFPTREQWPLAVIIIAAGCVVLEIGSRIVRAAFTKIRRAD